jgi:hypothetical protein
LHTETGLTRKHEVKVMSSQARHHSTTKPLSSLFRDPFLRAALQAAEDDGLAPALVETGGAEERMPSLLEG